MPYFGILNLSKPSGVTSRDAVDAVLRLTGKGVKVGHAGTLDPLASGVLVVCLGPATRLIDYVQRMPKRYLGTFLLGRTSDTEDVEGQVTPLENPPVPERAAIEAAAAAMVGVIQQRPPAYSALKVAGRRAYKLARKGQPPDLAPRPVTIHAIELIEYDYPRLTLDIRCGSGTYVRSLGRDLAQRLGTGAVMSELVRTEIGSFNVRDACELAGLTAKNLADHLLPSSRAVEGLPVVKLTAGQVARIANGRAVQIELPAAEEIAALDQQGEVVAVLAPRGSHLWGPKRVFVEQKLSTAADKQSQNE